MLVLSQPNTTLQDLDAWSSIKMLVIRHLIYEECRRGGGKWTDKVTDKGVGSSKNLTSITSDLRRKYKSSVMWSTQSSRLYRDGRTTNSVMGAPHWCTRTHLLLQRSWVYEAVIVGDNEVRIAHVVALGGSQPTHRRNSAVEGDDKVLSQPTIHVARGASCNMSVVVSTVWYECVDLHLYSGRGDERLYTQHDFEST